MAEATIISKLSGLYKEVYADDIIRLVPDFARIVKKAPFAKKRKIGKEYHQPVVLADEQGFTYSNTGGAFELNKSVSMETQDAKIGASQIAVRYRIAMDAASRAAEKGARAFRSATQLQYENVMNSFGKRLELALLYGETALVDGFSAIGSTSGTVTTLTVPASEWSFMWAGMERAMFQFYDGTSLVSSGLDSHFQLTSVNMNTKQLVFTGTATGTTALQAVTPAADLNVWFLGSKTQQMAGLYKIFTNTGTLFGINAADWALWKTPNVDLAAAPLTFQAIIEAMVEPVGRGLTGNFTLYLSPDNWAKLANDAAALRKIDNSYKTTQVDLGTQSIKYYYQGGAISIESHLFVKNSHCIGMPDGLMKRIGSTEVTSANPKIKGATSDMFYMLPDNMGFESRMYTDQALFFEQPAKGLLITNFT